MRQLHTVIRCLMRKDRKAVDGDSLAINQSYSVYGLLPNENKTYRNRDLCPMRACSASIAPRPLEGDMSIPRVDDDCFDLVCT